MESSNLLNEIKFVKYTPLLLPLIKSSDFDCGNKDLNEFLKEDLEKHREYMLTQSTLIIYQDEIIGYFSLQTDAIKLSNEERSKFYDKGFEYKTFPAVKIGRLAIDKKFSGKGIGTIAIRVIVGIVKNNHKEIASRFITVDSKKDDRSINFYTKHHNFIENIKPDSERETVSLRYDLYNPPKNLQPTLI